MTKTKVVLTIASLLMLTVVSEAKSVRATELNESVWSQITSPSAKGVVIEFREGDEIPMNFTAEGDLVETRQAATSSVRVKRNFWLKVDASNMQISFNGRDFNELSEVLSGSLEAGADSQQSGGLANAINIAFKSFVK